MVDLRSNDANNIDATITMQISSNGTFQSRGQQTIDSLRFTVSCVGADDACESIALGTSGAFPAAFDTLPCTSESSTTMIGEPIQIHNGDFKMNGFLWDSDGCNAANNMLGYPGFPTTLFAETEVWDSFHHGARIHTQSQNTGLSYYCNITGDYHVCPPIPFSQLTPDQLGMDATITLTMRSVATWTDANNFVAEAITMEADCEGPSCEALATQFGGAFPCASVGSTSFVKFDWATVSAAAAATDLAAFSAIVNQSFIVQTLQGNNYTSENLAEYMAEVNTLMAANPEAPLDLAMMRTSVAEAHTRINLASGGPDAGSGTSNDDGDDDGSNALLIVILVIICVVVLPGIAYAIWKKQKVIVDNRQGFENPVSYTCAFWWPLWIGCACRQRCRQT